MIFFIDKPITHKMASRLVLNVRSYEKCRDEVVCNVTVRHCHTCVQDLLVKHQHSAFVKIFSCVKVECKTWL